MTAALQSPQTETKTGCFHCGEPLPLIGDFRARIDGQDRAMCCPGCVAVATLIDTGGFSQFYRQRTEFSQRPEVHNEERLDEFSVYDDELFTSSFVTVQGDGHRTAQILVGGITCAACTWLIEGVIKRIPGVITANVSLNDARLDVEWADSTCRLSVIFRNLQALGYRARPYETSERRAQARRENRESLKRLAVAGLGMMQVGMFAIALHAGELQGIAREYESLLRWVSLPVASFVVFYSARGFFTTAWRHLRHGLLVMDLPIAVAIGLAFAASVYATVMNTGAVYFDSVVMFTFFLLLGRYLEQAARQRLVSRWSDTEASLPVAVTAWRDNGWGLAPTSGLRVGDRLLIRPGEVVAADARVTKGGTEVREDTFTGESMPRRVTAGDAVYAGTINVGQSIEASVHSSPASSRLAMLLRSVAEAQTERPALATLADSVAGWFVGGVLLLAAITFASWSFSSPEDALWVTLSVLVISCPCALALATPAALTAAATALRNNGIVVNGENALESLMQSTHLVFDKTGTLTQGELSLNTVHTLSGLDRDVCLSLAAALQQHSTHPVAKALANVASTHRLDEAVSHQGAGIEAQWRGRTVRMGSDAFCRALAPGLSCAPQEALYWVALVEENRPLAWLGFVDCVREEATEVIDFARERGVQVTLLTGDASAQVDLVADALGIEQVVRGASPQQKVAHVRSLQAAGDVVCMIGDGLNDAPVLGAANVSIAVAEATELARTQAALVITDGSLGRVTEAYRIADSTYRVMRQNIVWALSYNMAAIPLAAAGLVAPWLAAIGMSASSLLVVLNALRLQRAKHGVGRG